MLCVKRSADEGDRRVFVGDDLIVTVVAIGNGHVTLGFETPRRVAVLREELLTFRQVSQIEAAAKGK